MRLAITVELIRLTRTLEAYSWGVCEYESEDGGDGFREGV